ncbi:LacI family DNA-binding transcriptional regulator [uncultured Victivallis sp.]|uniref:LacI family DNA-binding transcriptional regulator n=1 Tax=uncultured Victivallis sp. TaxID=354118 RepID=UPI0025EBE2FD|nr:LacI family DNA-binding transcriptional regulator [uncultured Victivallis sp.]
MTISEIAKLAGVSTSTVSRVFSHHPNIREDVRNHVFAVARQHGYHPRISNKQKNVVIITPYNSDYPVHSCVDMLLMALTQELPPRGFRLEILPHDNLERLAGIQFCGAVAIGAEPEDFRDWPDRFTPPLVLVDRKGERMPPEVYQVRSDENQGMELAINHLYERGCRKIGCIIHGDPGTGNADLRRAAIERALREHGLPANDYLIHFSGPGTERYVDLIGKLLRQNVDALFCPGGNAGIVSLYAFSLFNKRIPDDISLIATEQTFFSEYAVPPQTTVTQDYKAVAAAVADVIEARIDGRRAEPSTVLPYRLIKRESVRVRG